MAAGCSPGAWCSYLTGWSLWEAGDSALVSWAAGLGSKTLHPPRTSAFNEKKVRDSKPTPGPMRAPEPRYQTSTLRAHGYALKATQISLWQNLRILIRAYRSLHDLAYVSGLTYHHSHRGHSRQAEPWAACMYTLFPLSQTLFLFLLA